MLPGIVMIVKSIIYLYSKFHIHDKINIDLATKLVESDGNCPIKSCKQSRRSRKGISWHISQSHPNENIILTNMFQLAWYFIFNCSNLNIELDISKKSICVYTFIY